MPSAADPRLALKSPRLLWERIASRLPPAVRALAPIGTIVWDSSAPRLQCQTRVLALSLSSDSVRVVVQ